METLENTTAAIIVGAMILIAFLIGYAVGRNGVKLPWQ